MNGVKILIRHSYITLKLNRKSRIRKGRSKAMICHVTYWPRPLGALHGYRNGHWWSVVTHIKQSRQKTMTARSLVVAAPTTPGVFFLSGQKLRRRWVYGTGDSLTSIRDIKCFVGVLRYFSQTNGLRLTALSRHLASYVSLSTSV